MRRQLLSVVAAATTLLLLLPLIGCHHTMRQEDFMQDTRQVLRDIRAQLSDLHRHMELLRTQVAGLETHREP